MKQAQRHHREESGIEELHYAYYLMIGGLVKCVSGIGERFQLEILLCPAPYDTIQAGEGEHVWKEKENSVLKQEQTQGIMDNTFYYFSITHQPL